MSMSATIAVSPSTVKINQIVHATLTVSNSSTSTAVSVTSVTPRCNITGGAVGEHQAASLGVVQLGPGTVVSVPATGSITFPFNVVFFSPSTGPIGAGVNTWDVLATVIASDGSVFAPSAATVTVNPLPLPVTEQ